jgi:hypothetical protein
MWIVLHIIRGSLRKMGAGVIPFCVTNGKVYFLFHKTFSGRRAGHLVDFGGGGREDEDYQQTAMREFVEETETMYFSQNLKKARITEQRVQSQVRLLKELFDRTLGEHPDWWCERRNSDKGRPKDWRTYFIEIDYRDLTDMNQEWRDDAGRRFIKRRELVWVASGELLGIYHRQPHRLWHRVRQLKKAKRTIRSIMSSKEGQSLEQRSLTEPN